MKSKYLCPVCGEAMQTYHYTIIHPRFGLNKLFDIECDRCPEMQSIFQRSEHLAYQKLVERVKTTTK